MSFFSDINGFNAKAIKSIYETKDENKCDFSEVDFCINDNDSNIFDTQHNNGIKPFTPFEEDFIDDNEYISGFDTEG